LVVFGSYTVYNGFALTQALTDTGADQTTATTNNLETETVQVGHDGLQFVPSIINLAAGKNYKIVTTPSSDGR